MNDQPPVDGKTLPSFTAQHALNSHLMAAIVDARGVFVWVSDSLCDRSGYRREELIGQPVSLLGVADAEPDNQADTLVRRCLDQARTLTADLHHKSKDGVEFWTRATLVAEIGDRGAESRCHLLETDITSTRRAAAEAEYANQAKSAYFANQGHDLRTPLNAILGFAQILQFDDLSDDQQDSVDEISRAARKLSGLITEVLEVTRIDSGRIELTPEAVAMPQLIDECCAEVATLADSAGISLSTGEIEPVRVQADPVRLKQVLLNLLNNAIQYNRRDGWVELALERLDDNRLRLSVRDSGIGVASPRQPLLFQPIAAQSGPHRGRQTGTGTGLYIARRLMEMMRGSIGFETEPNRGSRFWFELPIV